MANYGAVGDAGGTERQLLDQDLHRDASHNSYGGLLKNSDRGDAYVPREVEHGDVQLLDLRADSFRHFQLVYR